MHLGSFHLLFWVNTCSSLPHGLETDAKSASLRWSACQSHAPIFSHLWTSRRGFEENSNYKLQQQKKKISRLETNLLLGSVCDNYSSENSENRIITFNCRINEVAAVENLYLDNFRPVHGLWIPLKPQGDSWGTSVRTWIEIVFTLSFSLLRHKTNVWVNMMNWIIITLIMDNMNY